MVNIRKSNTTDKHFYTHTLKHLIIQPGSLHSFIVCYNGLLMLYVSSSPPAAGSTCCCCCRWWCFLVVFVIFWFVHPKGFRVEYFFKDFFFYYFLHFSLVLVVSSFEQLTKGYWLFIMMLLLLVLCFCWWWWRWNWWWFSCSLRFIFGSQCIRLRLYILLFF